MEEDFVVVFRPRDEVTASIVKNALEDSGIAAVVRPYRSSVWDGIFVPSEGAWGDVLVPAEDAERASAVLKDHPKVQDEQEEDS